MGTAWNQRGMTVVEVLIAAGILVVGLTALITALAAGHLDVVGSGGQATATAYARQVLEQFKNQPFNPGPANGTDNPQADVTRTWTITPVAGTVAPNRLARISVTVTWRTGGPQSKSIVLETMRAE
ncbi:MAG: hypothetical protein ACE5K9_08990 [Candidatus Methylomirabilales bacterium]